MSSVGYLPAMLKQSWSDKLTRVTLVRLTRHECTFLKNKMVLTTCSLIIICTFPIVLEQSGSSSAAVKHCKGRSIEVKGLPHGICSVGKGSVPGTRAGGSSS